MILLELALQYVPWHVEQPEGEGGGDQDGGQVALLRHVKVLIFLE